jgi:hypothetical protein
MKNAWLIAHVVALIACGSGSSDSPSGSSSGGASSTSSSGGSSSGGSSSGGSSSSGSPEDCAAICTTTARIAFLESNTGARLEGATVEACFKDVCAKGVLARKDGGAGYELPLLKVGAAAGSPPAITASILVPPGDDLRFEVTFDFVNQSSGLANGDPYKVTAKKGDDPFLFEKSFSATYEDETVCGSTCKVYEAKP